MKRPGSNRLGPPAAWCATVIAVCAWTATGRADETPATPAASPAPRASCWPGPVGSDPADCPPNDPHNAERWEFRGDIPAGVNRSKLHPAELALGSIGFSLDRAWQRTIGRDDVIIAVLDSGIRWESEELRRKLYLNPGELPLPAGSSVHDANGDGLFDVLDYAGDPRVGDLNGNGVLDAGDLIRAFSDCRDDDGNGYPDDISGYDFFAGEHCGNRGGDNDPTDDTRFGHGTGIAASAAAETNNGREGAGVCPRCRVLPVRVGDSFVVDADQFARGVVFAVRAGATVLASALGSYNNTPAARYAVDFAYARGVPFVASAADEYSYHHNYPSVYPHALYVNAIRHNSRGDWHRASTFWVVNPCTNYGARVSLTVPATTCSSGATSRLAGVVGLVQSMARDAGRGTLEAEEVYQLLQATADDLDNSRPDWGNLRWPARAGFDQYYGYGRLDAARAVEAVAAGRIPPIVDLEGPRWFAVVSPERTPAVSISGTIRLPRATEASWRLAYALGVEPREEDYRLVAQGTAVSEQHGVLGVLDFSELPLPAGPAPRDREERDRYSATLRLAATDDLGRTAEARRSFFVVHDPSWMAHLPLDLGASGEATPVVVDLDHDGRAEIVLPTADGYLRILRWQESGLGEIRAPLDVGPPLDPTGAIPPALDQELRRETVVRGVAVGRLVRRGPQAIVVASRSGKVYVFDAKGERIKPFPVALEPELGAAASPERLVESGILSTPVLADLDGAPGLEIVVSALDGHLYAWHGDGRPVHGFPVRIANPRRPGRLDKLVSTPAVGDLDGDGRPEIVVGSNGLRGTLGAAYAVYADGEAHPGGPYLPGWPVEIPGLRPDLLPTLSTGIPMTPILADVDGDHDDEVVLYAVTGSHVWLIDQLASGEPRVQPRYSLAPSAASGFRGQTFLGGTGSALVWDTDGDGALELYAPLLPMRMLTLRTRPGIPLDVPVALGGWELAGRPERSGQVPMIPTYPRRMEDLMIFAQPAAADVDGDGAAEVLMGSGGWLLHAFKKAGGEAAGFPKFTGGWIFSAPATGDLDGDGRPELVAVTREGYLFAWKLDTRAAETRAPTPAPATTRRAP